MFLALASLLTRDSDNVSGGACQDLRTCGAAAEQRLDSNITFLPLVRVTWFSPHDSLFVQLGGSC